MAILEVGIDFGIRNFITLSTGKAYKFPTALAEARKNIARMRRQYKQSSSPGLYEKMQKARGAYRTRVLSFLKRLVQLLTRAYKIFWVEDIHKEGFRGRGVLKAIISAMPWRRFILMLKSECRKKNLEVHMVSPVNTTKTCSACGFVGDHMPLKLRVHTCTACGISIDRDVNSGLNMIAMGKADEAKKAPTNKRRRI